MQRRDIDKIENKLNAILRLEIACEFKHLYGKSHWIQLPADLPVETLEQYRVTLEQLGLQVHCHANEDELDGSTRSIEFVDPIEEILRKLNLDLSSSTELVVRHSFTVIPAATQGSSALVLKSLNWLGVATPAENTAPISERKTASNLRMLCEPLGPAYIPFRLNYHLDTIPEERERRIDIFRMTKL